MTAVLTRRQTSRQSIELVSWITTLEEGPAKKEERKLWRVQFAVVAPVFCEFYIPLSVLEDYVDDDGIADEQQSN